MKTKKGLSFFLTVIFVLTFSANTLAADLPSTQQLLLISPEMNKLSNEKIAKYNQTSQHKSVSSNLISPNIIPGIDNSKYLGTSGYIPQPDNTTCGPTSAHNLLLNWGKDIPLSTLESDLGWSSNGGAPFGSQWVTTLNSRSGSSYYVITSGPSQDTIWSAFSNDTLDNHPFILDVHMSPTNGYLPGYSNYSPSEYWHYLTGNGYSGYYNTTKYGAYFDPFDKHVGSYGQHTQELSTWVPLLRERGIIW